MSESSVQFFNYEGIDVTNTESDYLPEAAPTPLVPYINRFGIRSRRKNIKSVKGPPGIGFKLTTDGNYDIYSKRLTNIGQPIDNKDGINIEYFDKRIDNFSTSLEQTFLRKNEDVDMNGKAIKNLPWPFDNNDALPKTYFYQYGLLIDSKTKNFNAKDKKIENVLDPKNQQDVATKNYVDNLDSAIQDSMNQQINKSSNENTEYLQSRLANIEGKVVEVDSKLRTDFGAITLRINTDLRSYVDDKVKSLSDTALQSFKSTYKLELSDSTKLFLDTIDELYLVHVNQHMLWLTGSIKPKQAIDTGNRILITVIPQLFPKLLNTIYFTYFKKKSNVKKVIADVGFITIENELCIFLPLEDQDVIIFDSKLYVF